MDKETTETTANQEKCKIPFQIMDGIRYLTAVSPVTLREAINYKPQSGDVCINIYPRCGSHWMQNTVLNIYQKGRDLEDPKKFRLFCPLIETMGLEGVRNMPRPGAYKTHLPFTKERYNPGAKYIFMAREPKDCCVANYSATLLFNAMTDKDLSFDEFFEYFIKGESYCNDYIDYILSWYPYRNKPNVFYTTYENMKQNTEKVVRKLAAFLGDEYIKAIETDSTVLQNIIKNTSFDNMKTKLTPVFSFKAEELNEMYPEDMPEGIQYIKRKFENANIPQKLPEFFRKGVVGDWKNWLTPEQAERLDRKFREKVKGTEILDWFPQ